jgi:transposase
VLTLPASVRIYVAAEAVDLRRGFDGLAAATRSVIKQDPLSGHLFVFLNRRKNRVKLRIGIMGG